MKAAVLLLAWVAAFSRAELVEWALNLELAPSSESNEEKLELLQPAGHYGGYFSLDGKADGHMFYFYFENRERDPDAPLVIWMNGGPGCSSLFGLFLENGPYKLEDDMSLKWNEYGWDVGHNIIFLEQPIGVGYSYGSSSDFVTSDVEVANDVLQFLYEFYLAHPETQDKDLFITGESYAGHYIPAIVLRILKANEESEDPALRINLAGMALGDPWINPAHHYESYPVYEYQNGLISKKEKEELENLMKFCVYDLSSCHPSAKFFARYYCRVAYDFCESNIFNPIFSIHRNINYYDIRLPCYVDGCYNVTALNKLMNQPSVKKQFGVPKTVKYIDCSDRVYFDMLWELAVDYTPMIAQIVDNGISTLVYVGDQDLICNYIGVRACLDSMEWSGKTEWDLKSDRVWLEGEQKAGEIKSHGVLSYVKIYQAGHMVPMDQPKAALKMITMFTSGEIDRLGLDQSPVMPA